MRVNEALELKEYDFFPGPDGSIDLAKGQAFGA
jgi:hypothetical protein